MGTCFTDPDFGTQIARLTDYSMSAQNGASFNLGSDGTLRLWSSDLSKLLVENAGGAWAIVAFNPASFCNGAFVSATSLHGTNSLGGGAYTWSATNGNILWEVNTDFESTVFGSVSSGSCLTNETMTNAGGGQAALLAMNSTALMQIGAVTGGTPTGSNWTGGTSGCVFTATATPTAYAGANTLYQGIVQALAGGTVVPATFANAANWVINYSLLFNFNYVAGVPAGASQYFPTSTSSCLPAGFAATWNGAFLNSDDDTLIGASFSDDGQDGSWNDGAGKYGAVFRANYKAGSGCRVFNTRTSLVTGDWGPSGQMQDGQHNYITGAMTGAPMPGDQFQQQVTGVNTQYVCSGNYLSNTPSAGINQYFCSVNGSPTPTSIKVGYLFSGTPDAVHPWIDISNGSGTISFTPSAVPSSAPYYYPVPQHDSTTCFNPNCNVVSGAGVAKAHPTSVQGNYPASGETTITMSSNPPYSAGQQITIYGLTGADDTGLNCSYNQANPILESNNCPVWTIVTGTVGGTASNLVISTPGSAAYTDSESSSSAWVNPNGIGFIGGYTFMATGNYWQVGGLTINTALSGQAQGHAALGYTGDARGPNYDWFNLVNPSLPCNASPLFATPCPATNLISLLPLPLPEDDHGSYFNHGTQDLPPVGTTLEHECGAASGGESNPCYSPFTAGGAWEGEGIMMQNVGTNPNYQQCNYGSGVVGCVYRMFHTFNPNTSPVFNARVNPGNVSANGQFMAWTSTMMDSLGAYDGTAIPWTSYIATGPAASTIATGSSVTISTDGSTPPILTVTLPGGTTNEFCAPGTAQHLYVSGTPPNQATYALGCGTTPEQIVLSGFPSAYSWANQTIKMTGTSGTCSGAGCTSTGGTLAINSATNDTYTTFSGSVTNAAGVPSNLAATPVATTASGGYAFTAVSCLAQAGYYPNGSQPPCPRSDIFVGKITTANGNQ